MFCGKFNNTVSIYSCLMLKSSNNGEGLRNWHFFRVLFGPTRFDLFANPTTSAYFSEDCSQPQILIAMSVERWKAHKMPFQPCFKEGLSENKSIGAMEDSTFNKAMNTSSHSFCGIRKRAHSAVAQLITYDRPSS